MKKNNILLTTYVCILTFMFAMELQYCETYLKINFKTFLNGKFLIVFGWVNLNYLMFF